MNKKMNIILLLIFLLFTPLIFAETIILKSGKTVEGKIIEKTDKSIKVDIEGIPITYYLDEIENIDGIKIKSSSAVETPGNEKETKPLGETKTQTKEANPSDKVKNVTMCQDWINSKPVVEYFRQQQLITREMQQKGQLIIKKLGNESETIAVLAELEELGATTERKMKELIPPEELSAVHKLATESMAYGQLALEAGINKDLEKADSYYIKQIETDKKSHEELKSLYAIHGCSVEFIQQIDKIIEEEEKEIKRIQQLHPEKPKI
ncbi:MAG: hypothetical protein M0R20_03720 [Candidatus Omnitrophica bacterium]|jgi:hypothetical protein|nr:hypothetical protein [Candidatus Omnitrophota bacterium]